MATRKNQATLTVSERKAFVAAVLKLKNGVPSQLGLTNRYDDYVRVHADSMMGTPGWAHRGPAFGPWHRAFIRNFELDLQAVDPSVSLPYWDWTIDQSADPTIPGSPWTSDLLGGNGDKTQGGKVGIGAFAFDTGKWTLNVREQGDDVPFLVRDFGGYPGASTLPTPGNLAGALAEVPYDSAPWRQSVNPSFRDRLEGWHGPGSLHNRVHLWVGGSMLPSTSPNDPAFFLHHCNVDRLWANWQAMHPSERYVPLANAAGAPKGHRLTDPMLPWGGAVTPQSTLDHSAMGYTYDTDAPIEGPLAILNTWSPPMQDLRWTYRPDLTQRPMRMGPMFELSPQDKHAGGHDLTSG